MEIVVPRFYFKTKNFETYKYESYCLIDKNHALFLKFPPNFLKTLVKFLLAPMGVLAPGSVHARHSAQPPIDTS